MKNISFLFLSLMVILASCGKDDEPNQVQLSSEEAAVYIATSLGGENGGLQAIFSDAVLVVSEATPATGGRTSCGATDNTTFNYASQQGETPAYSFNYDYGWTLNCGTDQLPASIAMNMSYDGNMESPEFTFDYEGSSEFLATNIMEELITLNGQHNQKASFDFSGQNQQYSGTNTFTYALTDVVISKETASVTSGTATVLLSGITSQGVYSVSATITYNGDGTATISINGDVYGIDISTGTVNG